MAIPKDDQKPSVFREMMGNRITSFVIWGTIIVGVVGIIFAFVALNATDEKKVDSAFKIIQYIFGALLPLWGTWIGTILAYYYSKENFESANRSVQQLVEKITSEKKLESVKAKDVMILKKDLKYKTMTAGQTLADFKIKEMLEYLKTEGIRRLLILNDKDAALYVIHRDLMSHYIADQSFAGKAIDQLTLNDMYSSSQDMKNTIDNSAKFINENSNLLDAKNLMDQNKTCLDVFITKTGKNDEPALGWITNVTITENSVV